MRTLKEIVADIHDAQMAAAGTRARALASDESLLEFGAAEERSHALGVELVRTLRGRAKEAQARKAGRA